MTWPSYVTPVGSEAFVLYSLAVTFPVPYVTCNWRLDSFYIVNHAFVKELFQFCNLVESDLEEGQGDLIKQGFDLN